MDAFVCVCALLYQACERFCCNHISRIDSSSLIFVLFLFLLIFTASRGGEWVRLWLSVFMIGYDKLISHLLLLILDHKTLYYCKIIVICFSALLSICFISLLLSSSLTLLSSFDFNRFYFSWIHFFFFPSPFHRKIYTYLCAYCGLCAQIVEPDYINWNELMTWRAKQNK